MAASPIRKNHTLTEKVLDLFSALDAGADDENTLNVASQMVVVTHGMGFDRLHRLRFLVVDSHEGTAGFVDFVGIAAAAVCLRE